MWKKKSRGGAASQGGGGGGVSVPVDERCFVNPYWSSPISNILTSTDLLVKLKEAILTNVAILEKRRDGNQSLYTGQAGLALLYLQVAYRLHCGSGSNYTECVQAALCVLGPSLSSINTHRLSFLCGAGGPLALAAHLHHLLGDASKSRDCVTKLKHVVSSGLMSADMCHEVLYGQAGCLYALLYVNSHVPGASLHTQDLVQQIVESLLEEGHKRAQEEASSCPLSFIWHGKHYLGAAHGLAGILTVLLQVPLETVRERVVQAVEPCVDYLLSLCFPLGNLPSSLESASKDRLVQWCHGAPGLVHLLAEAYKVYGKKSYLEAALCCGEVVWERGLLLKGYSLCHGVAGNAYTFLQLYQLTNDSKHLDRAARFAEWCLNSHERQCGTPDHPYSLFEGLAGVTYFYCDLLAPEKASFPALQLWSP